MIKYVAIIPFLFLISCSKNNIDLNYLEGSWSVISEDKSSTGTTTFDSKGNYIANVYYNRQHMFDSKGTVKIDGNKIYWNYDSAKSLKELNSVSPTEVIEKGKDYFITQDQRDNGFSMKMKYLKN